MCIPQSRCFPLNLIILTITAFVGFEALPSISSAGTITYSFNSLGTDGNGNTFAGSITTDGKIGQLSASDVVDWTWFATSPADAVTAQIGNTPQNGNLLISGDIEATATEIFMPMPNLPNDTEMILGRNSNITAFIDYLTEVIEGENAWTQYWQAGNSSTVEYSVESVYYFPPGDLVIATVTTPGPPAWLGAIVLIGSLAFLRFVARKRNQRV